MFCRNCGSANDDNAAFCAKCGTALNGNGQPTERAQQSTSQNNVTANTKTNTIAIVGFVLSFFIAIAGLVCSIIGYSNCKNGAPYKGLAIAGIVISAAWFGFVLIAVIAAAL